MNKNQRGTALQTVLDECTEMAGSLPFDRRVSLYRALAVICADGQDAAQFEALATEETRVECQRRRLQCTLKFGGPL